MSWQICYDDCKKCHDADIQQICADMICKNICMMKAIDLLLRPAAMYNPKLPPKCPNMLPKPVDKNTK